MQSLAVSENEIDDAVEAKPSPETGLPCIRLLCAMHGIAFDPTHAQREFIKSGHATDRDDLLRILKATGFKTRAARSSLERLAGLSLPA